MITLSSVNASEYDNTHADDSNILVEDNIIKTSINHTKADIAETISNDNDEDAAYNHHVNNSKFLSHNLSYLNTIEDYQSHNIYLDKGDMSIMTL